MLLANKPAGELDTETSHQILDTLRAVCHDDGVSVVVTHDISVSDQVERTVAIRDGRTRWEVRPRRVHPHSEGGVVAQDYAVMDRAGQVQIPREYREALARAAFAGIVALASECVPRKALCLHRRVAVRIRRRRV